MVSLSKVLVVVVSLGASACSSRISAGRFADIEVPVADSIERPFDGTRVLLRRFVDARPAEYSRSMGGAGIIVGGSRSEYTTALVDETKRGETTVHVGWLPSDLPYLLARALPSDNVGVADELSDAGAGDEWDYVVEGRVLRTQQTSHYSIALVYLGVVGLPMTFERYVLKYELSLYAAEAPDRPLLTRTYDYDERVSVGWYYNHKRARTLPMRALQTTVGKSARDLVLAISKHRGRQDLSAPPTESAPPSVQVGVSAEG